MYYYKDKNGNYYKYEYRSFIKYKYIEHIFNYLDENGNILYDGEGNPMMGIEYIQEEDGMLDEYVEVTEEEYESECYKNYRKEIREE